MNIKTKRLIVRTATSGDAPFFLKLLNDPTYISMIRDSGVRDVSEAERYINDVFMKSYTKNGFGLYVLEHDGTCVGICGFVKRATLPIPDLGFALLPEYKGRGYIREAATALIHFAREELHLRNLAAITTLSNHESIKTLKNLGFMHIGKKIFPENEKEFEYYELEIK